MCGSKCAWCKNSTPTENGGWKCPWISCHLSEYEIKIEKANEALNEYENILKNKEKELDMLTRS